MLGVLELRGLGFRVSGVSGFGFWGFRASGFRVLVSSIGGFRVLPAFCRLCSLVVLRALVV